MKHKIFTHWPARHRKYAIWRNLHANSARQRLLATFHLQLTTGRSQTQLAGRKEWHVVVLGDAIISALACISMLIANALAEINFRFTIGC